MSAGFSSASVLAASSESLDGPSVSLKWLEMVAPTDDTSSGSGNAGPLPGPKSASKNYGVRVIENTNNFIKAITNPLNLISVIGPARSGKSTLMNMLAGCTTSELFPSSPGSVTFTKGIYVPSRILKLPDFSALEGEPIVDAQSSDTRVSFIDTEGQGAVGTLYDMNLFSPALICSKVVIYNRTGGLLTDEILTQLGMMTQAAQRLTITSANGTTKGTVNGAANGNSSGTSNGTANGTTNKETDVGSSGRPCFGHLVIIFNQYRLNPKDNVDTLTSGLLGIENENDDAAKNRNKIRNLLATVFESVKVFILPDGQLVDGAMDGLSDGTKPFLLLNDFKPKYLGYFKLLREALSQRLVIPRELDVGAPLTGGAMSNFVPKFATAINSAEPLNIPSIFQSAQNDAINTALLKFTQDLSDNADQHLKDDPRATAAFSRVIDSDINVYLSQLTRTLSYMPQAVVMKAQDDARKSAEPIKNQMLSTNLTKLKTVMENELTQTIQGLPDAAKIVFPDADNLISEDVFNSKFDSFQASTVNAFQKKGADSDPNCLPNDYAKSFDAPIALIRTTQHDKIAAAWQTWLKQLRTSALATLTTGLTDLNQKTPAGATMQYKNAQTNLSDVAKQEFTNKIDSEYNWTEPEGKKATYIGEVDALCKTRQAIWESNSDEVQAQLKIQLKTQEQQYQINVQNSLQPQQEPRPFGDIVDAKSYRDRLESFIRSNGIAASVSDQTLLDFDVFVSSLRANFMGTWNQASTVFVKWLQTDLDSRVPALEAEYISRIDLIDVQLGQTVDNVTTLCEAEASQLKSKVSALRSRYTLTNSSGSDQILENTMSQVQMTIKRTQANKRETFSEVVSIYNKVLLSKLTLKMVNKAVDPRNSYVNEQGLNADVATAKSDFFDQARGGKSSTDDGPMKWSIFESKTVPALLENVRRQNGYFVNGIDGNLKEITDILTDTIKKINGDCANLANSLGMSWINSDQFNVEPTEETKPGIQLTDPSAAKDRVFRMKNTYSGDGYWNDKRTELVYFEWDVSLSDIAWGTPVVTEMRPRSLDSREFPVTAADTTTTLVATQNESSVITDNNEWGVNGGFKFTIGTGKEAPVNVQAEVNFNASFKQGHSEATTSSYSWSTSYNVVLPGGRTNVLNQMVFDQRTSLPYTAKMKVRPRVKFSNGFTRYNSGSYRDDANAGAAIRDSISSSGRCQRDFEFPLTDTIIDQANRDQGDWYWQIAMQRHPEIKYYLDRLHDENNYMVYVRGNWQGITGKYTVTTVTPKSTALTLVPDQ